MRRRKECCEWKFLKADENSLRSAAKFLNVPVSVIGKYFTPQQVSKNS